MAHAMLTWPFMLRRAAFAFAFLFATFLASSPAHAQAIAFSQSMLPDRILPDGSDIGTGPRATNLTPTGISYADCIADQRLRFYVIASGFTAGQSVEVWASETGTCTNDAERNTPGSIDCWNLGAGTTGIVASTNTPETYDVRVQDLVGAQNGATQTSGYVRRGAEACSAQPTFTGVSLTIFIIPVAGNAAQGTALQYTVSTDLVGPPPPDGVAIKDGDTLFNVVWTPNPDSDTQGYDVYLREEGPANVSQSGSRDAASTADAQIVCHTTGSDAAVDANTSVVSTDAADDVITDGATDATVGSSSGGSGTVCVATYPTSNGTTNNGGTCNDPYLSLGTILDASASTAVETVETDAGDGGTTIVTDEAGASTGTGGISAVSPTYLVGASSGETASGESTGNYIITGLTNGTNYTVAVSAVDGFGNIGPPSTQACDYPAPVNDFFTTYRKDGGQAGGSFCALEAVGGPAGASGLGLTCAAAAMTIARRRRKSARVG